MTTIEEATRISDEQKLAATLTVAELISKLQSYSGDTKVLACTSGVYVACDVQDDNGVVIINGISQWQTKKQSG